jgi:hypothetical protein
MYTSAHTHTLPSRPPCSVLLDERHSEHHVRMSVRRLSLFYRGGDSFSSSTARGLGSNSVLVSQRRAVRTLELVHEYSHIHLHTRMDTASPALSLYTAYTSFTHKVMSAGSSTGGTEATTQAIGKATDEKWLLGAFCLIEGGSLKTLVGAVRRLQRGGCVT